MYICIYISILNRQILPLFSRPWKKLEAVESYRYRSTVHPFEMNRQKSNKSSSSIESIYSNLKLKFKRKRKESAPVIISSETLYERDEFDPPAYLESCQLNTNTLNKGRKVSKDRLKMLKKDQSVKKGIWSPKDEKTRLMKKLECLESANFKPDHTYSRQSSMSTSTSTSMSTSSSSTSTSGHSKVQHHSRSSTTTSTTSNSPTQPLLKHAIKKPQVNTSPPKLPKRPRLSSTSHIHQSHSSHHSSVLKDLKDTQSVCHATIQRIMQRDDCISHLRIRAGIQSV